MSAPLSDSTKFDRICQARPAASYPTAFRSNFLELQSLAAAVNIFRVPFSLERTRNTRVLHKLPGWRSAKCWWGFLLLSRRRDSVQLCNFPRFSSQALLLTGFSSVSSFPSFYFSNNSEDSGHVGASFSLSSLLMCKIKMAKRRLHCCSEFWETRIPLPKLQIHAK